MIKRIKIPPLFAYIGLVLVLVLILDLSGLFKPLRGLAEKALIIPLKEKVYTLGKVAGKNKSDYSLDNEKRLVEYQTKIASLTEENQEQKRLLSAPLPKNWKFMTVKVIGFGGETLTLASGKEEGVSVKMVAVSDSTYLGKVFEVSEHQAKVKLPSFIDEKLAVKIVSADQAIIGRGLLVGRGIGRMKVEQILANEDVKKGDLIMAETEGGNLSVGEILEVTWEKGEVFKTAQVKALYDPANFNTIFLVTGKI